MGRSVITRTAPNRARMARTSTEKTAVMPFHEETPEIGGVIARFMAPGAGSAGPFMFRIDALQGDFATFEIALYQADVRTQRVFIGRQGAGALDQSFEMKAGDRLIITLKSIAEKAQGDTLSIRGVWTTFDFKWVEESKVPDNGEGA